MSTYPHLKNAPIKEALIDIQVLLDEAYSFETMKDALLPFFSADGFSKVQSIRQIEIHGGRDKEQFVSGSKESLIGFRYDNADNTKVIQARANGFTFSHLKPYPNWEDFVTETKKYWDNFKQTTKPKQIRRVATRFINSIPLTSDINVVADLKSVFTQPLSLPNKIPQQLQHYFSRIVTKDRNTDINIVVIAAFEQQEARKNVVLDIDIFKELPNGAEDGEIWNTLNVMREFKNDVFFNLLTDQTIERFK